MLLAWWDQEAQIWDIYKIYWESDISEFSYHQKFIYFENFLFLLNDCFHFNSSFEGFCMPQVPLRTRTSNTTSPLADPLVDLVESHWQSRTLKCFISVFTVDFNWFIFLAKWWATTWALDLPPHRSLSSFLFVDHFLDFIVETHWACDFSFYLFLHFTRFFGGLSSLGHTFSWNLSYLRNKCEKFENSLILSIIIHLVWEKASQKIPCITRV